MSWYSSGNVPQPPPPHQNPQPLSTHSQKHAQFHMQPQQQVPPVQDYNQNQWVNSNPQGQPQYQPHQQLDNGVLVQQSGWNNQPPQTIYYNINPGPPFPLNAPAPQLQQLPNMTSQHFQTDPNTASNDGWGDWGEDWAENSNNPNAINNNVPQAQPNFYNNSQFTQQPPPVQQPTPQYGQNFDSNMNQQMPPAFTAPPNASSAGLPPTIDVVPQNVIEDSFSTTSGMTNWNWNASENAITNNNNISLPLVKKQPVFDRVSPDAVQKMAQQRTAKAASTNQTNQPDDVKNTQQMQNQQPLNWSSNQMKQPPPPSMGGAYSQVPTIPVGAGDLDNLDQALMALNVMKVEGAGNHQPQPITPSVAEVKQERPPSVISQLSLSSGQHFETMNQEIIGQPERTLSISPNVDSRQTPVQPPPLTVPPPALQSSVVPSMPMKGSNLQGNPFKRTGGIGHRGLQTDASFPPNPQISQPAQAFAPIQPLQLTEPSPTIADVQNHPTSAIQNNQTAAIQNYSIPPAQNQPFSAAQSHTIPPNYSIPATQNNAVYPIESHSIPPVQDHPISVVQSYSTLSNHSILTGQSQPTSLAQNFSIPSVQDHSVPMVQSHSIPLVQSQPVAPILEVHPTENRETITPNNNDRNQYLQTSHLSEESDAIASQQSLVQDLTDNLPPPGLSRLVLGEPELEPGNQMIIEPPVPGFDRMVPGTDLENASGMNMEREADGQASIQIGRSNYPQQQQQQQQSQDSSRISDRNLYLVPGESVHPEQTRVVTGNEIVRTFVPIPASQQAAPEIMEQTRDLEMEGENLEDQRNDLRRSEPIEGANTGDDDPVIASGGVAVGNNATPGHNAVDLEMTQPTEIQSRKETSTGEESERDRNSFYKKPAPRARDDKTGSLRRKPKPKDRYDSEESDYGSERERDRRRYREGSYRGEERDKEKENRRYRDYDRDRYRDDDSRYGRDDRKERKRFPNDPEKEEYHRRRRDDQEEYDSKRDDKDRRPRRGEPGRDRDRPRDRDNRRDDRQYRGDRRYRDKDRRGYEYEEDYNRSGSRNTERSRDPRMYYQQGYGYDYGAYSQQQYYETLRRTNPQAYAEWYRKYYAQMAQTQISGGSEMPTDGRESVHSGRSSTNDKDRYNRSLHQQYPYYGGGGGGAGPESLTMLDGGYSAGLVSMNQSYSLSQPSHTHLANTSSMHLHYNQHSYYTQSEFSDSNRFDRTQMENDQQSLRNRSTPLKFTIEHSQVAINNGMLVYVKPKYSQNGVTNLVKIINVGSATNDNDLDKRLFAVYPGPLVRGSTHKKTVIEFCEERIRLGPVSSIQGRDASLLRSHGNSLTSLNSVTASSMGKTNSFKASYNLLWDLLILLLRQNGMVVGTDIAELLLKNTSEFPHANTGLSSIASREDSVQSSGNKPETRKEREGDLSFSDIESGESGVDEEPHQEESSSKDKDKKLSEEEITEKFRNYLLYGNVTEALDWATDNNLWGHALFLASKVDRRSHANVMMKFANKLALNDPLQTLYQLMSLRMPSSVTSVVDKKWGDWRPHLAMIISNTSQKPDLDRKAITTLGDSLFQIGDTYGSHFCYLMAQVGFGKYETGGEGNGHPNSKLILLGSSPNRSFKEFATTESIMMTEIYEYACTLNEDKFSIVEFQPYKFMLATRLLDYGYQLKTFLYMEQLGRHIQYDYSKYESSLIRNVCDFADRLRYYDPMQEKTLDDPAESRDSDGENQKWIHKLRDTLTKYQGQFSTESYTGVNNQQKSMAQAQATIDQQFSQINQQFSELNLQYQNFGQQQQPPLVQQYADYQQHSQQEQEADSQYNSYQYQPPQSQDGYQDGIGQQQMMPEQPTGNFYNPNVYDNGAYSQPLSLGAGDSTTGANTQMGYDYYGQHQGPNPEPKTNLNHPLNHTLSRSEMTPTKIQDLQESPKRFPNNQQLYEEEVQPQPQITMPSSASNRPGFYDDEPAGSGAPGIGQSATQNDRGKAAVKDKENKSLNKDQSSGWFGGIWGKFSLKPKNQMILPDDKNPSIVWDPDKKRWVNTDGDVAEEEAFKPPPKMSDLGMQPPMQMQTISPPVQPSPMAFQSAVPIPQMTMPMPSSSMAEPNQAQQDVVDNNDGSKPNVNNLRSNQFKLQRNRTLKKSYVDVFNPSGAPMKPIENVMAPSLPNMPQAGGFLIPGAAPVDLNQNQHQNTSSTPQFYNPNQYAQ